MMQRNFLNKIPSTFVFFPNAAVSSLQRSSSIPQNISHLATGMPMVISEGSFEV
jgi:hypothetical protein